MFIYGQDVIIRSDRIRYVDLNNEFFCYLHGEYISKIRANQELVFFYNTQYILKV